jgi:parallel beta-helix repeat protein
MRACLRTSRPLICLLFFSISTITITRGQITIRNSSNVSYSSINEAVAAAAEGNIIDVPAGTYDEDVLVNKSVQIIGAGADVSVIRGVKASINKQVATLLVTANNVFVTGFTITRNGNNVKEWNDGLDTAGVILESTVGVSIQNNKLTGNQVGVVLHNASGDSILNNIIYFNRTGIVLQNDIDMPYSYYNAERHDNTITNNWTTGIKWQAQTSGNIAYVNINNNFIDSNWYSQVANNTDYGGPKSFTRNWLGGQPSTAISSTPIEPDYTNQIPKEYGGNAVPPKNGTVSIRAVSSQALDDVVYTPYYSDAGMQTLATVLSTPTLSSPVTIGSTTVTSIIPAGVTVTTQPNAYWDGVINPPAPVSDYSGAAPSGFDVGNTVIEVGSIYTTLYLSSPATLTLTGVNGPIGYSAANSNNWTLIADTCGGTYDSPSNPTSTTGACTITNGIDTKILTYHFTRFGTLTGHFQVAIPTSYALPSGTDANTVYIGYAPASKIILIANAKYGSGNYSYLWSNGATTQSVTVSPKTTTNYTVMVRDINTAGTVSAPVKINVADITCGDKNDKVSVCQKASANSSIVNSICIAPTAVEAHLMNGDHLGDCKNSRNVSMTTPAGMNEKIEGSEFIEGKIKVQVSPNPAYSHFNITLPSNNSNLARVIVFDELGRVVETRENIPASSTFQIGEKLSPGIYITRIIQGDEKTTIKLIKVRN